MLLDEDLELEDSPLFTDREEFIESLGLENLQREDFNASVASGTSSSDVLSPQSHAPLQPDFHDLSAEEAVILTQSATQDPLHQSLSSQSLSQSNESTPTAVCVPQRMNV